MEEARRIIEINGEFGDANTASDLRYLGEALLVEGSAAEAAAAFGKCMDAAAHSTPIDEPYGPCGIGLAKSISSMDNPRSHTEIGRIGRWWTELDRFLDDVIDTKPDLAVVGAGHVVALQSLRNGSPTQFAGEHGTLGVAFYKDNRMGEAEASLRTCLAGLDAIDDHASPTRLSCTWRLANTLHLQRPGEEALTLIDEATALYSAQSDADLESRVSMLSIRGDLLGQLSRFDEAIFAYEQALRLWKPIDEGGLALTMGMITLHLKRGEYDTATRLWEDTQITFDDVMNEGHRAEFLVTKSAILRKNGSVATARNLVAEAIEIQSRHANPQDRHLNDEAASRYWIFAARIEGDDGQLERAVDYYERARSISERKTVGRLIRARKINDVAMGLLEVDRVREAVATLEESATLMADILETTDNDRIEQHDSRGRIHYALGEYAQAHASHRAALDIYRAQTPPGKPDLLPSAALGTIFHAAEAAQALGRFEETHALRKQAVRVARRTPQDRGRIVIAEVNADLARVEMGGELAPGAVIRRLDELTALRGERHQSVLAMRGHIAKIALASKPSQAHLDQMLQVIRVFEDVYGIDHTKLAVPSMDYGTGLRRAGQTDDGNAWQQRSFEIVEAARGPEHPNTCAARHTIAEAAADDADLVRSEELHRLNLIYRTVALGPFHLDTCVTRASLAKVLWRRGGPGEVEARTLMQGAVTHVIDHLEDVAAAHSERVTTRRIEHLTPVLDNALSVFHRPEDAGFAYATLLRWQGVVGHAARMRNVHRYGIDENRWKRYQRELDRTLADIAYARNKADDSDSRSRRLEKLTVRKEELQTMLGGPSGAWAQQPDLADVCDALPMESALVHYFKFRDILKGSKVGAFVVQADGCEPIRVDLEGASSLRGAVSDFVHVVGDPTLHKDAKRAGTVLRELVWPDLLSRLIDEEDVTIVAFGQLATAPLAALPMRDGTRLLESKIIRFVGHPADLVRARPPTNTKTLLVGDIDYGTVDDPTYTNELGAVRLMNDLMMRYKDAKPLHGRGATPSEVADALQTALIAHIVTHGFGDGDARSRTGDIASAAQLNPMAGAGVALTDANLGPDGILTAEQVAVLDLTQVGLVILAACDSGGGAIGSGNEVIGWRNALTVAGARSQVLSVVKANPDATAELMVLFFDQLDQGEDVASALRNAQLSMLGLSRRHKGSGLTDWGPFVAVGHWAPPPRQVQ